MTRRLLTCRRLLDSKQATGATKTFEICSSLANICASRTRQRAEKNDAASQMPCAGPVTAGSVAQPLHRVDVPRVALRRRSCRTLVNT
jgi:hypothetical protein